LAFLLPFLLAFLLFRLFVRLPPIIGRGVAPAPWITSRFTELVAARMGRTSPGVAFVLTFGKKGFATGRGKSVLKYCCDVPYPPSLAAPPRCFLDCLFVFRFEARRILLLVDLKKMKPGGGL
jgi:hypothetical protein